MDKLRDKYKRDIERGSTVRVIETKTIRLTGSTEKLTGDDLQRFLNEEVGDPDVGCEYQDDLF